MKRVKRIFALLTVAVTLLLTGCSEGRVFFHKIVYAGLPEYEMTEDGDVYEADIDGRIFRTVKGALWKPESVYDDKPIGKTMYNGVTLVYATSSPDCLYIRNSRRPLFSEMLAPDGFIYAADTDEFKTFDPDEISGIRFAEENWRAGTEIISDKAVVDAFKANLADETSYAGSVGADARESRMYIYSVEKDGLVIDTYIKIADGYYVDVTRLLGEDNPTYMKFSDAFWESCKNIEK